MISFRYHVVTVVAILFALAAGVALGHGLQGSTTQSSPAQQTTSTPSVDVAGLQKQLSDDARFIDGVSTRAVAGSLTGSAVVLVVAPGADPSVVSAISRLLPLAGGTVVGRVDLGADAVDPASRQLVDELTSQLVKTTKGIRLPTTLSTYERFGALLGRAVSSQTLAGAPVDSTARSLTAGLSAGRLAVSKGSLAQRAGLILIVAPSDSATSGAAAGTIIAATAKGLASQSAGVLVVAGRTDGQTAAAIEEIRNDPQGTSQVATEDAGDLASGQVVAILGLAAAGAGDVGQYGVGDSAGSIIP